MGMEVSDVSAFAIQMAEDGCWELTAKGFPVAIVNPANGERAEMTDRFPGVYGVIHVGLPNEDDMRKLARWLNHQADHVRDAKPLGVPCDDEIGVVPLGDFTPEERTWIVDGLALIVSKYARESAAADRDGVHDDAEALSRKAGRARDLCLRLDVA